MQLTITNLSKTYPNGTQALKGIDLVKEGFYRCKIKDVSMTTTWAM